MGPYMVVLSNEYQNFEKEFKNYEWMFGVMKQESEEYYKEKNKINSGEDSDFP